MTPPEIPPEINKIAGVRLATAQSGITYQRRDDLMLMCFDKGAAVAGVFTRSSTAAAPIAWCRQILNDKSKIKAILCNAGNANAFTGKEGEEAVKICAKAVAEAIGCAPNEVIITSTGVIGERLPHENITPHIADMVKSAEAKNWHEASVAIGTTDTFPKAISRTAKIGTDTVVITGIAKGSGMIAPNMATMLGFIATDANLSPPILQKLLTQLNEVSFNAITVDGDTSTNDTLILAATAAAKHKPITRANDPALKDFTTKLLEVMQELAKLIVRDGEGARKRITIHVKGAENDSEAKRIGLAIGNSPLVKTAIAGGDANWGRIIMAVGKAGAKIIPQKLAITIGGINITQDGARHADYDEDALTAYMQGDDITIEVNLNIAKGQATIWTCDLTERYIAINADYRS